MPHIPDHQTHDLELVAAYAAGDATGPDLAAAAGLVADCPDCAALHRDLRAISAALPELPPAARPRDFRLTPEQAAALRPSGWRGVLAAFASPRFRLAAPLGTGLAAAGLAGLLLASPRGLQLPASADTGATAAPVPAAGAAGAEINPQTNPAALPDVPSAAASEAAASGAAAFAPVASAAASENPAALASSGAPSRKHDHRHPRLDQRRRGAIGRRRACRDREHGRRLRDRPRRGADRGPRAGRSVHPHRGRPRRRRRPARRAAPRRPPDRLTDC